MKIFLPLLITLAACSGSSPEYRQPKVVQSFIPPEGKASTSDAKATPRPDPLLMPGDLLRVTVFRQPDLDLETRILETGVITYPLIGAVQAKGKTAAALQESIRAGLKKDYLENPDVNVTVKEFAKRRVYIVGGIAKPDGYEMAPDAHMTVFQLVAAAGGFTDRAYKEYVQVVRRQSGAERTIFRISLVDAERRLARGEPDADLELWPEDLVMIPSAARVAHVLGAVQRPGPIDVPLNARLTLSMAVAHAGSYGKFASTSNVLILRHSPWGEISKRTVDLDAVLGGRVDLDLEIEPGDVVFVPERGIF